MAAGTVGFEVDVSIVVEVLAATTAAVVAAAVVAVVVVVVVVVMEVAEVKFPGYLCKGVLSKRK